MYRRADYVKKCIGMLTSYMGNKHKCIKAWLLQVHACTYRERHADCIQELRGDVGVQTSHIPIRS